MRIGNRQLVFLWGVTALVPFIGYGAITAFDVATALLLIAMAGQFSMRQTDLAVLFGFFASIAISNIFSYDFVASALNAAQWLFLVFLVGVVARMVGLQGFGDAFWKGLQVSALLTTCLAAADLYLGNSAPTGGRYVFVFTSPQPLAFLFIIVVLVNSIGVILALRANMGFKDFLALGVFAVGTILSIGVLLATASRTGLLGVAVGEVLVVATWFKRRGNFRYLTRWGGAAFVLLAVGSLYAAIYMVKSAEQTEFAAKLLDRIEDSLEGADHLVAGRTRLLEFAIDNMSARELLVGTGLDAYTAKYTETKKPHNVFLLILVEGGIVVWVFATCIMTYWAIIALKLAVKKAASVDRCLLGAPIILLSGTFIVIMFNTAVIQRHLWVGAVLGVIYWYELMVRPRLLNSRYLQNGASSNSNHLRLAP